MDGPRPGCSYEYVDGPVCGGVSGWHVVALDDGGGVCGFEACERHRAEMAAVAAWVHPWTPGCVGGGFVPSENRCAPAAVQVVESRAEVNRRV